MLQSIYFLLHQLQPLPTEYSAVNLKLIIITSTQRLCGDPNLLNLKIFDNKRHTPVYTKRKSSLARCYNDQQNARKKPRTKCGDISCPLNYLQNPFVPIKFSNTSDVRGNQFIKVFLCPLNICLMRRPSQYAH